MYKKELVMILVLGVLFSLSGVFAGHFVEINGTVYYRVANTSTLSSYEINENVTNGTIDLTNNIGGVLSDSLLQNVSPVVYLFPVADSTLRSGSLDDSRTFIYNVSDDSDELNCSLYSNRGYETINETVNNNENNTISWANKFPVGAYEVYISCIDQYENVGNSNNVTFQVLEPEDQTTTSGGGGTYSLTESALDKGLVRNVWKGVVWKFNAGEENHTITFNNVSSDILIFTVASSPRIFNVKMNKSVLIDVEEDGVYDLNITYNKYYGNLANVGAKAVSVGYGDGEKETQVTEGNTKIEVFTETKNYTDWIIGIIIVALIIAGLVLVNRRVKHKRTLAQKSK